MGLFLSVEPVVSCFWVSTCFVFLSRTCVQISNGYIQQQIPTDKFTILQTCTVKEAPPYVYLWLVRVVFREDMRRV